MVIYKDSTTVLYRITSLAFSIVFLAGLIAPATSHAQEFLEDSEQPQASIIPVITSEDFILLEKSELFDAGESTILPPPASTPIYRWSFSDTTVQKTGKELIRSFNQTGRHQVTLTITQGTQQEQVSKIIFVYDTRILLITDQDKESGLDQIVEQAADNGVLLKIISAAEEATGFLTEEAIVKRISEESEFIDSADAFIFYTESSIGLQSFTRYWRGLEDQERKQALQGQFYAHISDENMDITAQISLQSFKVIQPSYILLTRREALNPIFEAGDFTHVTSSLSSRAIEYRVVDERSEKSRFFILSRLVTNFVAQGVPSNTIYLILAFPFVAFIIAFARQILGLSAFGVYTPAMIAISFLILGINFGMATLLIVIVAAWILRWLLNKIELLFIPRTALVISSIALSFLGVIWFLLYYGSSIAISLAIFPMLVMSTVTEKFMSAQSEEGLRSALFGVLRTIIVAGGAYYFVVWPAFADILTSTPELVLLPLFLLIILGKFTGLRLGEYFRFKALLREGTEE
ncbi:7TM domain-containing protein [Patescibacteria group bacterium]